MMYRIRCRIFNTWDDEGKLLLVRGGQGVKSELAALTWGPLNEAMMMQATDGIEDAKGIVQAIMDAAWEGGFRPSGFQDVKNETAAIRDHLADMKTIAFNKLGIK